MKLQDHCDLIVAFARVLYVNGQSTEQTVAAAEELARTFGLRATVMPRWGQMQLEVEAKDHSLVSQVAADPTGVDMQRVVAAMSAIEDIRTGRLAAVAAMSVIGSIAKTPPAPTWLFTLAAALGAAALAVTFGVSHRAAVASAAHASGIHTKALGWNARDIGGWRKSVNRVKLVEFLHQGLG